VTEKFTRTRELMAQHLLAVETFPVAPPRNPVICFAAVQPAGAALLFSNLSSPTLDAKPQTMEKYDQGFGCILYRTTLPAGPEVALSASAVHDVGLVFLDGQRVGVMDRRSRRFSVQLPARNAPATLDILVEAMGRVNFGTEVHDRKGLHSPVQLGTTELTNWQIFSIPLDAPMLAGLKFNPGNTTGPAFWRFNVNLDRTGDTWLDMRPWGKGVAWINGHCLGRFWNIGPSQTMYVPGPWLKQGQNEIIILDLLGPQNSDSVSIAGRDEPILDQLRPRLDIVPGLRPAARLVLNESQPVHTGEFAPGSQMQEIRFAAPVSGRYFAIETQNAHDGKSSAAIAEIDLLDPAGNPISHEDWIIAFVSSEERDREDGSADNAINGQTASYWHTRQGDNPANHPHRLVIDLGRSRQVSGIRYVPRQGSDDVTGRIRGFRVFVGDGLVR
jgi:beta-galactosidase